jgi:hypothetical protein
MEMQGEAVFWLLVSKGCSPTRHGVVDRKFDQPAGEIMPNYLCLQRSLAGGDAGAEKPSPAQMQAMYEKFNEWREKFQKNLVDLGGRLGAGKLALPDPAPDGPFVEVKELVGGYMVVAAANLDEAIQIARECPGLMHPGSGVEVIEIRTAR